MTTSAPPPRGGLLPVLALVLNALVWGLAWWPFRHLEAAGLHPLWATAIIFSIASAAILAARPRALRLVATTPALWLLVVAAGTTNAAFTWGIVIGDVVRVVLLFYLMPLWAVILARLLLGERLSGDAVLRIVLGLAGAAIVLWPEHAAGAPPARLIDLLPLPRDLGDWLGVVGGFSFALNNVLLRRFADRPEAGRALAMFVGGALVAGVLAAILHAGGSIAALPAPAWSWVLGALVLSVVFLAGNLALQYGAARLPADRTAVVMLTEVIFASASAVALGAGTMSVRLAIGGLLIVAGALLAARRPAAAH